MTTPIQHVPSVCDSDNELLAITPTTMVASFVTDPRVGKILMLTFRTASTTFTVLVPEAEASVAQQWAEEITDGAAQLGSKLILG